MAGLREFIAYLDGRLAVLGAVETQLCGLQEKYEAFFAEISEVREREFQQLLGHVQDDRAKLPDWFNQKLDRARKTVEQEYDAKAAELERKHDALVAQAEEQRRASSAEEQAIHGHNVGLDQQEEWLKARNEQLLAAIGRYNDEIRRLGTGFGFFAGLFRMRKLSKEREKLDQEQTDVAARIAALRHGWTSAAQQYAAKEQAFRARWVELETEAAALRTKLDYLASARERIVLRSTLERTLYDLAKPEEPAADGDPKCRRCGAPNRSTQHFCQICAARLVADRPDFEGSIHEMAELNRHHQRFSEGMRACQEIIGLTRGLKSGVEAFKKSVVDVQDSESRHNLATLRIDVPARSVEYGRCFDALAQSLVHDWSLHPKVLADRATQLVETTFTEPQIKDYFETMGQELSRQADSQW